MKPSDGTLAQNSSVRIDTCNRRSALELLCIGAAFPTLARAFDLHCSSPGTDSNFKNYTFVFFTPAEQKLLDTIMEMIIPADEHSGGASEAKVPAFADLMVSTSDETTKQIWRSGIRLLEKTSRETSLDLVLAQLIEQEKNPQTELEKFFSILKLITVQGYYTSWIGIHQDMEYQGNEYRASAPSCNHPGHQE